MNAEFLDHFAGKRVLLLQGPMGPFSRAWPHSSVR